MSVCIDRAVFASIEDSDSDPDNHGDDSSSNTSADDHMTTKRTQCRLQGAGVKEVSRQVPQTNVKKWARVIMTRINFGVFFMIVPHVSFERERERERFFLLNLGNIHFEIFAVLRFLVLNE